MKINDRVRILGTDNDFLEQYIGTIGVVESCDDLRQVAQVQCSGGDCDRTWAFEEKNLEVVNNARRTGQRSQRK
jgi:hypothetical protein